MLYSYSFHLRHDTYRSLPLSHPNESVQYPASPNLSAMDHDADDGDLYQLPLATGNGSASAPLSGRPSSSRHAPMLSGASFTEFVGAHNSRGGGWPDHRDDINEDVAGEEEHSRSLQS
jgi:hypothetical protein